MLKCRMVKSLSESIPPAIDQSTKEPVSALLPLGPVELISFGQHHALQVVVLSPLLQPLLLKKLH